VRVVAPRRRAPAGGRAAGAASRISGTAPAGVESPTSGAWRGASRARTGWGSRRYRVTRRAADGTAKMGVQPSPPFQHISESVCISLTACVSFGHLAACVVLYFRFPSYGQPFSRWFLFPCDPVLPNEKKPSFARRSFCSLFCACYSFSFCSRFLFLLYTSLLSSCTPPHPHHTIRPSHPTNYPLTSPSRISSHLHRLVYTWCACPSRSLSFYPCFGYCAAPAEVGGESP
jgi:hypothetical protein